MTSNNVEPVSPSVYCLLDANLLAGYYAPQTLNARSRDAAKHIRNIIDSVRKGNSPHIKLLVPEICVAEAQTVLSKHANLEWKGTLKRSDPQSIHGKSYNGIVKKMRQDLHGGKLIESLPLQRYHVLFKHLISPIDHHSRIKNRDGTKPTKEMGGTDQLICGMAVWLCRLLGRSRLLVLTADYRMARVLNRATRITDVQIVKWGIREKAERDIGFIFTRNIFPHALYLPQASERELRKWFESWPLPTRKRKPRRHKLAVSERNIEKLVCLYKNMNIGRDRLPYSRQLSLLTKQFNNTTGLALDETAVWQLLISRLKKPGGTMSQQR